MKTEAKASLDEAVRDHSHRLDEEAERVRQEVERGKKELEQERQKAEVSSTILECTTRSEMHQYSA